MKYIEIEKEIKEIVDNHLNLKRTFTDLPFQKLSLKKTHPRSIKKESVFINDPIFRALRKVFNYIYTEFENSENADNVWERIYAFPPEEEFRDTEYSDPLSNKSTIDYINASSTICENFLMNLLQKAKDLHRTTFSLKAASNLSKFFVIGDIGIGKTSFFKYIYSKYKNVIREKKIFWLHLDLNNQYLRRLSIPEAIKFEVARQFRKTIYDNLSNENTLEFEKHLKTFFKYDIEDFSTIYRDYKSVFEYEQTEPYNKNLQIGIIKYIEKMYSPIYIIDGLDQFSNGEEIPQKFEDIKDIISDFNRSGVFLFIMRKDTHLRFLDSYSDVANSKTLSRLSSNFKKLEIIPAKLFDIIFRRFDLLVSDYEKIILENRSSILNEGLNESESNIEIKANELIEKLKVDDFNNITTLNSYLEIFFIFLYKGIKPEKEIDFDTWDIKRAISDFKNFIGTNFRVLMDAINIIHDVFLEALSISKITISDVINLSNLLKLERSLFFNRINDHALNTYKSIMKRDYKVIPMLLEGYSHYSHPYNYELDSIEGKIGLFENRSSSRFIYSIFYPVNVEDKQDIYTLLLKVRILQFLNFNLKSDITEPVLLNYFSKYFPYEINKVNNAIVELCKSLLIEIEILPAGHRLRISRTGENHINFLIKDFGYLRIILDDILVPSGFEELFIDQSPELYSSNREHWIINQVPRVALFLLLIKNVEFWEEANSKIADFTKWRILEKIKSTVVNRVIKICVKHDIELKILKESFQRSFANIRL
ncbi:MAG: hypothetical protein PHN88_00585 [Ignavibacteria bacterium]|nr:hypothetical protein [Ignavibacteria bacterium]